LYGSTKQVASDQLPNSYLNAYNLHVVFT